MIPKNVRSKTARRITIIAAMGISAVLAGLGLPAIGPSGDTAAAALPDDFRVMTYNLKAGGLPEGPAQQDRYPYLSNEITRNGSGPDVAAVQEFGFNAPTGLAPSMATKGYAYLNSPAPAYSSTLTGGATDNPTALTLFYKTASFVSVEAPTTLNLYTGTTKPSTCDRVKGRAAFFHMRTAAAPTRHFVFVNVHLSAKSGCASVRTNEFNRLRNRIVNYMNHPNDGSGSAISKRGTANLIVLGDFNTQADAASDVMEQRIFLPDVNTAGRGINLARIEVARNTMNKGWNASSADDTGKIDHVFYQKNQLNPINQAVQLNYDMPCTLPGCAASQISASDHYPLRADLSFQ